MASIKEVGLRIIAMLGLDTSAAKAGLKEFERDAERTAEHINKTFKPIPSPSRGTTVTNELASQGARITTSTDDASPLSSVRAHEKLSEFLGPSGKYSKNRKAIQSMIREEWQTVRDLEEQYRRLKSTQGDQSKTQQGELQKQIKSHRDLAMAMRTTQESGEVFEATQQHKQGWLQRMRGGVGAGFGQGMSFQRSIRGGGAQQVGNSVLMGLMANPVVGTAVATAGIGVLGYMVTEQVSRYSEDLQRQSLGISRRIGFTIGKDGVSPVDKLYESKRAAFKEAGYSKEDVLKIMAAFSLPGMTADDSLAHAHFGRKLGLEPEMIAGVGRRARQMGEAPAGGQSTFFRSMAVAVAEGQKNGVDASETMKALLGMTAKVVQYTGVVSREYTAGVSGLLMAFGKGGHRIFAGEVGAANVSGLLEGFANPQNMQTRVMLQYELMKQFGNKMPDAKEIGLSEHEAPFYGRLNDISKGNYILQKLPELMANQDLSDKTRNTMGTLLKSLGENLPAKIAFNVAQSMFPKLVVSEAKGGALSRALHEEGLEGNLLQQLGEAITRHGLQWTKQFLDGQEIKTSGATAEKQLSASKDISELLSSGMSKASGDIRSNIKGAIDGFATKMMTFMTASGLKNVISSAITEALGLEKGVLKATQDTTSELGKIKPEPGLPEKSLVPEKFRDMYEPGSSPFTSRIYRAPGLSDQPAFSVDESLKAATEKLDKQLELNRETLARELQEIDRGSISPGMYVPRGMIHKQSYQDNSSIPSTLSINVSGSIQVNGGTSIDGNALMPAIVSYLEEHFEQQGRMRPAHAGIHQESLV